MQEWISWLLCSGSHKSEIKVSAGLLSLLEAHLRKDSLLSCWKNLFLCGCRSYGGLLLHSQQWRRAGGEERDTLVFLSSGSQVTSMLSLLVNLKSTE